MKVCRKCCVCGSNENGQKVSTYFNGKSDINIQMSGDCCICKKCLDKCEICTKCGKKIKTNEIKEALGDLDSFEFCHCKDNDIQKDLKVNNFVEDEYQCMAIPITSAILSIIICFFLFDNCSSEDWFIIIFGWCVITSFLNWGIAKLFGAKVADFDFIWSNTVSKIKLPSDNYSKLGYLTTAYLLFVMLYAWGNTIDYGYYEVLRWAVSCFAFWSAYRITQKQSNIWFLIFMAIGILFNPIVKIALDKDVWQIIDLITFVIFCFYGLKYRK